VHLSYHDTISYTDHFSAFSNQSQRRQIVHYVRFSGMTFSEHVQATKVDVPRELILLGIRTTYEV
ncbi:unnamed protein product, partial [Schistosoma mattheei]